MQEEKRKGHPVFLILGLATLAGAVLTYLYDDVLVDRFANNLGGDAAALVLAMSLLIMVGMTLFFIWCYRSPRMGDRILGRNQGVPPTESSGFKYTGGGFDTESAAHEKKQNSRRKSARAMRKQMAARQREIDAGKEQGED